MLRFSTAIALIASMWLPPSSALAQSQSSVNCNASVIYDASTSGNTQLLAAGSPIYVCGYSMFASATVTLKLVYGTGTACATGTVSLTPGYPFVAQTGLVDPSPTFRGMGVPGNNALCINSSVANPGQAIIYYSRPQ